MRSAHPVVAALACPVLVGLCLAGPAHAARSKKSWTPVTAATTVEGLPIERGVWVAEGTACRDANRFVIFRYDPWFQGPACMHKYVKVGANSYRNMKCDPSEPSVLYVVRSRTSLAVDMTRYRFCPPAQLDVVYRQPLNPLSR